MANREKICDAESWSGAGSNDTKIAYLQVIYRLQCSRNTFLVRWHDMKRLFIALAVLVLVAPPTIAKSPRELPLEYAGELDAVNSGQLSRRSFFIGHKLYHQPRPRMSIYTN